MHDLDLHTQNTIISRVVFRLMSKAMALGAVCWFSITFALGLHIQSLVPLVYLLVTAINLYLTRKPGHPGFPAVQMTLSIALPFLMQLMLGGVETSGVVMLWSFAALCGALTYRRYYMILTWSALEILLVTTFSLFDPKMVVGDTAALESLPPFRVLFAINLLGPTFIILGTAVHFVRMQGGIRKHIHGIKAMLAESNTRLEQRTAELDASLRYARTIQLALLPDLNELPSSISDGLVFYRPKDPVGGDLFWHGSHNDQHFVAIMDCTGHGVPGALLTVIVHNLLNEIVVLRGETEPAVVVAEVVQRLPLVLQRAPGSQQDGVELAIVRIDRDGGIHRFAGMGLGLIVVNEDQHFVLKGGNSLLPEDGQLCKDSILAYDLDLTPGARLYAFTDGFWHQFGGEKRRKFSRTRLQAELINMSHLPWNDQRRLLEHMLDDWRGELDQVDDILVLGFEPVLHAAERSKRA